jgi:hypothetical protein
LRSAHLPPNLHAQACSKTFSHRRGAAARARYPHLDHVDCEAMARAPALANYSGEQSFGSRSSQPGGVRLSSQSRVPVAMWAGRWRGRCSRGGTRRLRISCVRVGERSRLRGGRGEPRIHCSKALARWAARPRRARARRMPSSGRWGLRRSCPSRSRADRAERRHAVRGSPRSAIPTAEAYQGWPSAASFVPAGTAALGSWRLELLGRDCAMQCRWLAGETICH